MVLQAVEHQFPNSAKFATLYHSCVQVDGHTNANTGKIVDTGVKASTLFDFRPSGAKVDWRVTVDGVMGGHSRGTVIKSSSSTCTGLLMEGTIELTHGGFVVAYSPDIQPTGALAHADGVRICSKATRDYGIKDNLGDLYKVRLQGTDRRVTYQADFHTVEAGTPDANAEDDCDGVISTLPFSHFWPTHWGRIMGKQGSVKPASITEVGLDVSFQTEDGGQNKELDHKACVDGDPRTKCKNLNPFGLCVQWVQYYVNAGGRH